MKRLRSVRHLVHEQASFHGFADAIVASMQKSRIMERSEAEGSRINRGARVEALADAEPHLPTA